MSEETKILLALQQVENIITLVSDNEYESYLISHLTRIQVELSRQLTNLTQSSKMRE